MPKSKLRSRGQKKQNLSKNGPSKGSKNLGAITINDFANASTGSHSRLKKAITSVACEVKQRLVIAEEPLIENDDSLEIKDNRASFNDGKINKAKTGKPDEKKDEQLEEGHDYPLDLWFLISEHICPESVGKFARICKKSNYVTHTAKFWFHLCRKYHNSRTSLPQQLQLDRINRPHGLRAYVIRALQFTYFQFLRGRDNKSRLEQKDPHSLVKRRCSLMWHKRGENHWYFFFKLKELEKGFKKYVCVERLDENRNENFEFNSHSDVMYNPEEGCKVLRVTSIQYSMVQPVIGLTLQTVSMHLSPGFEHHRLVLGFGSAYVPKTATQMVTLVGVVHVDVIDWWQVQYPYQDYQEVESNVSQQTSKTPIYDSWEQIYSGIKDRDSLVNA